MRREEEERTSNIKFCRESLSVTEIPLKVLAIMHWIMPIYVDAKKFGTIQNLCVLKHKHILRTTVSRSGCSLIQQRTMIGKKGWTSNSMQALEQFATLLNIVCQFYSYFLHRRSCDRMRKLSIYVCVIYIYLFESLLDFERSFLFCRVCSHF